MLMLTAVRCSLYVKHRAYCRTNLHMPSLLFHTNSIGHDKSLCNWATSDCYIADSVPIPESAEDCRSKVPKEGNAPNVAHAVGSVPALEKDAS